MLSQVSSLVISAPPLDGRSNLAERLRCPVEIPLDRKAELPADLGELAQAEVSELDLEPVHQAEEPDVDLLDAGR